MTTNHMLAFLGMKDSGKTTYLARLWLGVHAKVGKLHAAGLPEQLRPLRDVSGFLLRNNYPQRTNRGEVTSFNVPLRWSGLESSLPFDLSFTDYSGEELSRIFEKRDKEWTDAWKTRSIGSIGLLIFLRANQIRRPSSRRLLDQDDASWAHLRGDALTPDSPSLPAADDPAVLFDPLFLPNEGDEPHRLPEPETTVVPPTAVALVEILQFLRQERGLSLGEEPDPERFRVAVAISCWDAVPKDLWQERGPEPFMKAHFPLLDDFLMANFHPEGVRIFGLSSTGGDLKDASFRSRYEQAVPEQMGELVFHPNPGGRPHSVPDITLPIGWLLEGERAFLSLSP